MSSMSADRKKKDLMLTVQNVNQTQKSIDPTLSVQLHKALTKTEEKCQVLRKTFPDIQAKCFHI